MVLKVIMYYNETEKQSVLSIFEDLELLENDSIVLIDAIDNKPSASNVKG